MADTKNDTNKTPSNQNKGSGSDTVSAAKISAGTSVGNVGQSPMPQAQSGSAGGSADKSPAAQSSTLASHTSKPLGGQPAMKDHGGTGQGTTGSAGTSRAEPAKSSQGGAASSGGQDAGMADTARKTADQARDMAGRAYDEATDWARDTYERASSWASDTFEGTSGQMSRGRSRAGSSFGGARQGVQRYVAQNPVMVGLVGLAAGLLIGALLPRTRREDEVFGEWADEVRRQGLRYAQDMTQRGREYVEEAFNGDEPQFSRHESEFGGSMSQGSNVPGRH